MVTCLFLSSAMNKAYLQNTVSCVGDPDVFGMEWYADVLSGNYIDNCCEDLVFEFSFLPELEETPQSAYAELEYFGDPNDLIYDSDKVSVEQIPNDTRYKIVIDTEFPDYTHLPPSEDSWKVEVRQVRNRYVNTAEPIVPFFFYHGLDDNGELNGRVFVDDRDNPRELFSVGPVSCEEEFNVQDLIDVGRVLPNDKVLSSLGIHDYGVFTVEQDLTIGEPFTAKDAKVGTGSEIVVEDGSTLEILGTDFIACKNGMWKGIYVEEGGHLIMKDCILTGAEFGIRFERGAELTLDNNTFRNNYVHMQAVSGSPGLSPSNTVFHEFSNNLFTSEDNNRYLGNGVFPEPYAGQSTVLGEHPFAGILLGEDSFFNLSCGPVSIPYAEDQGRYKGGNVFEKMANGIVNQKDGASLRTKGCKFKNLNSTYGDGYDLVGFGIYHEAFVSALQVQAASEWPSDSDPNSFENLDIGVFSSISSILSIEGQIMSDVRRGIETSRTVLSLQINDNEIYSKETAIAVSNTNLNRNFPYLVINDFSIADNIIEMKEENDNNSPVGISGIILSNVIGAKGSRIADNSIEVDYGQNGLSLLTVENMAIRENTISDDGNVKTFTAMHAAGGMNLFISCNQLSSQYTGSTSQSGDTHGLRVGHVSESIINCNAISNTERGIRVFGNCSGTQIRGNTLDEHLMGVEYGYDIPLANYANTGIQEYNGNRWLSSYAPVQGEFGAKHNDSRQYRFSRFIVNDTEGAVFTTVSSPSDFVKEFDAESNFNCASFSSCGTPPGIVGGTTWEALDSFAMKHDSIGSDDLLIEQFRDLQWQVYRRMQEGSLNTHSGFATTASNLGLTALYQDRENLLDIILLDTLETVTFGQVDVDTIGSDYLWTLELEVLDWYEQMQSDLDQWSTTGSENIFMNMLSEGLVYTKSLWQGEAAYADSVVLEECIPYGGQGWYLVNSLQSPEQRNLGFDLNCPTYRFAEQKESVSNFRVYPNPSSGMLRIEAPAKLNTNQYRMYNANGQMVQEGTFVNDEAIRLNAEIQAGIYYITVGNAVQKISVVR